MTNHKMIVIGEKEYFIVRVLIKKIRDLQIDCSFVPCTVNDISENLSGVSLIALFMEDGELPKDRVIIYLNDIMKEKNLQMLLVGEKNDVQHLERRFSGDLIYKTFIRPVDNEKFSETIKEYMNKADAGELRKSILVVDDDPQYLMLVREWLKDYYKVSMANSGLQALKWLGNNKVDLILLDHEMPVTSGPQVLEMLRSDHETRSIPVMFLTGKSDKESVMAVVALKPEGYILKSVSKEELVLKLQEYFILHKQ